MNNWTFNESDSKVAQDIQDLLPDRVFDIHAHVYRVADLNLSEQSLYTEGPQEVTVDVWRKYIERYIGRMRLIGELFIATPIYSCDIDKVNDFLISQLKIVPDAQGLIFISQKYPTEKIIKYLRNPQIKGFNLYHFLSDEKPTFQASLASYLPEWAWEIADQNRLIIMLHVIKERPLADSDNQREIYTMCTRYPSAKLILPYAGRDFHTPNTVGWPILKGLQNIWFDIAGVCEANAITALLHEFGPRRILWGSDFPVSETRGKCVTVGEGFVWINPDTINWHKISPECHPILIGLESLRALKEARNNFCLNTQDLQDIFCDNALRLLGIKKDKPGLTQRLYSHAKERIPGGTQLLSKRPEMMAPEQWPAYFREARGCEVWDIDGHHYYDVSTNGIGSCLLGFRDPDVTRAVQRRINLGSMCSLNAPEEVELADLLCEIHPWSKQVRFTRSGGEAAAVAVRIARATTGRSIVAVCGYHGWHDWYLAANLGENDVLCGHLLPGLDPLGVPKELRGTTVTFKYNSKEEFQNILDKYGERLAAIIMEPCRNKNPESGFLEFIRNGAHRYGAMLIFDEITIGWRLHFGGVHLKFKVNPDIAIFAKALGNGHPIGAIIGTEEAMAGAQVSFISSTYWTESVGPTAALTTIRKMKKLNVTDYVAHIGTLVIDFWQTLAAKHRLPVTIENGYPCLAQFSFDHELKEEIRTFYTQLMLERGFLAGCLIYPTMAHTEEIVSLYGRAIDEVFGEIADALVDGNLKARLKGPVAHSGFKRLVT